MRILLDNGTPRGVASAFQLHSGLEARARGWDRLSNGELLAAAEADGFDVLLTTDRNIRYQQSLANRKIAVVVLGKARWRFIKAALPAIVVAVEAVEAW